MAIYIEEKIEDKIIVSFKELMKEYPFEKITVTMIAEKTGITRPTFYNHFKDKYELMDYMVYTDITKEVNVLLKHEMLVEALRLMFTQIQKEKTLYKKLFEVVGQNSFEQVMANQLMTMMDNVMDVIDSSKLPNNSLLRPEIIERYIVIGLTHSIKEYLNSNISASIDEAVEAYYFLVSHSMFDLVDKDFIPKEIQKSRQYFSI